MVANLRHFRNRILEYRKNMLMKTFKQDDDYVPIEFSMETKEGTTNI